MSQSINSQVNVNELKDVLKHVVNTNRVLQTKGLMPTAINVVGQAGLGKTSTISQVGIELGFKKENIVKLSLSTFEEIGDLIGIPVVEYKMIKKTKQEDGTAKTSALWISEMALSSYEKAGWTTTNSSRMSYSPPEWISGKTGPGILILDDYTRASQRFTQAVMELVLCQEYASWSLPKGWTIILSSNPDDGAYNVTDQDPAQKSRYMNIELGWDAEVWAQWAEKNNIDSRCINFTLMNKEVVSGDRPEINPRSISLFFNTISSLPNFNDMESLKLIQLLGEGSLGVEVTTQFTAFIHNKMDKLITTEEILDTKVPFADIENQLAEVVNTNEDYRGDIAFVIATRLLNYVEFKMTEDDITDDLKQRAEDIISSDVLGSDLKFVIGRKLINTHDAFTSLLFSKAVVDNILE
jgi:hypothetical protein